MWSNASGEMLYTLGIIIILYSAFAIWFLWEVVSYHILNSDKNDKSDKSGN